MGVMSVCLWVCEEGGVAWRRRDTAADWYSWFMMWCPDHRRAIYGSPWVRICANGTANAILPLFFGS